MPFLTSYLSKTLEHFAHLFPCILALQVSPWCEVRRDNSSTSPAVTYQQHYE